MENKDVTRSCGQCHKEVAEANFALHETHCSRFLCVCSDCNEAVPREQLNQHREEQHTQVRCTKCNQKIERCHLMDHESDECVERLQICPFCELELPWKQLDKHCLVCGSRTELCRDCSRYVTRRDQPGHGSTCSATNHGLGPPQTTSKLQPNNSKLECISAVRWEEEEEEAESEEREREDEGDFSRSGATAQLSSTYKATSMSDSSSSDPWSDGGDSDQISTCPHCHLALPLHTLRWHKVKCQIHILLK